MENTKPKKKVSTTARGNRYKSKTKEWYQRRGWTVQLTEFNTMRPIGGGKVVWTKRDVFGSDGISMNGKEIIFWNSKHISNMETSTYSAEVSKGRKEFASYPFPPCVRKVLVVWVVGRRGDPDFIEI